jgi:2-furoyl-CoA dehydrogenase large subunit
MTSFQPATESQTGHIGARQTRVEDAALLCGLGCYADDAAIPPGHAHARITLVEFSKALLMKGVRGVLMGESSSAGGTSGSRHDFKAD